MALLASSHVVCKGVTGVREFRERLKAQGIDLTGKDIDHVFPRSWGGVDHPWNYEVMSSSLNRSLGNDLVRKFAHAPLGMVRGIAVSALALLGRCRG